MLCYSLQTKRSVAIRVVELYRNCIMLFTKFGLRPHQKCTLSEEKSCTRLGKAASFHLSSPALFLSLSFVQIFPSHLHFVQMVIIWPY